MKLYCEWPWWRSARSDCFSSYLCFVLRLSCFCFFRQTTTDSIMTEEEAIQIVQMVERAWQGRLRAKLNKAIRFGNFDRRHRAKNTDSSFTELAAIQIQKVISHKHDIMQHFLSWTLFIVVELYLQFWRAYIQRKKTRIAQDEEMIYLGMVSQMIYFIKVFWIMKLFQVVQSNYLCFNSPTKAVTLNLS